ncbi:MAG: WD40 repeat domain-containing protein [Planctomycetes bacterium]|nr:WD40 repeat domain-containing protein [Planctomycetota bacterium]
MSTRLLLVVGFVTAGMGSFASAQGGPGTDRQGDALPEGAFARLGTVRFRGAGAPLVFSQDGKVLASVATGSERANVILWEVATGKRLRRLSTDATTLSLSPDAKRVIVSSHLDFQTSVIDVSTGRTVYKLPGYRGTFSGDGKLVFSADPYPDLNTSQVHVWDVATGKARATWPLKRGAERFCVSSDGRTCALGCYDNQEVVRILDLLTGKEKAPARKLRDSEHLAGLSPDGKTLAITGRKDVSLWDVATGKEIRRWKRRFDGDLVSNLVFAADGKRVAWSDHDKDWGSVHAWVAGVGDARPHAVGETSSVFEAPAFSPDGKMLAVPTAGHVIVLRDVVTGKDLRPFEAHTSWVDDLALAADGRTLVSGDRFEVLAWDWPSGRLLRRYPTERPGAESALRVVAGGRVLCRGTDGLVRVRDGRTGRETLRLEGKHGSAVVAVSADGSTAALVGEDRRLRVFDLGTGKVRCSLEAGQKPRRLSLSPGGHILFWCVDEGEQPRVFMADMRTGRPPHLPGLPALSWRRDNLPPGRLVSPDGRWLVVPTSQRRLPRWDLRTGKELEPLLGGHSESYGVFYSPDSRFVVQRGFSQRSHLRVWEIATGRLLDYLAPEPASGDRIMFSADGRTLFTTDYATIHLWEVATNRERGRLEEHLGYEISSLALTSDGRTLFSGGDDTQVLAWDLTGRRGAERTTAEQVRAWWDALAGANVPAAYRAVWALASDPEHTLPLLRRQLHPVPTAKPDRVARLIADLDHERFAVRRRAAEELEEFGEPVAPALRKALGRATGLESRRRIEQVLDEIERPVPSGRRLQALRAVEVLERIGTPAAREVLRALAAGAAGARLTSEARISLERRPAE